VSESQSIISSLYLPVSEKKLLLPNVCVAEVVDYQEPTKQEGLPDYYLGKVNWRGIEVPVVSYEIANGAKSVRKATSARIAVVNTVGGDNQKLPFFAIVTRGIPRLVKITEDSIKTSKKKKGPADAALVRVDGEDAAIPKIDFLESLAHKHI